MLMLVAMMLMVMMMVMMLMVMLMMARLCSIVTQAAKLAMVLDSLPTLAREVLLQLSVSVCLSVLHNYNCLCQSHHFTAPTSHLTSTILIVNISGVNATAKHRADCHSYWGRTETGHKHHHQNQNHHHHQNHHHSLYESLPDY